MLWVPSVKLASNAGNHLWIAREFVIFAQGVAEKMHCVKKHEDGMFEADKLIISTDKETHCEDINRKMS